MFKVRRGSGEEIPLVQGKRNPSKTVGVARGHQRADTLKPYSHPRAKEKPQQDGRRGEIAFRIKPHTHQRC